MPPPALITLSHPHPTIHLLTLSSAPDNRLTPAFLAELAAHLDTIEALWRGGDQKAGGAVVITSDQGKFFSNGLDYEKAMAVDRFFEGSVPQLTFASPLPNSFPALLTLRIPHPPDLRDTLLARRWTQKELLERGIVDAIIGPGELVKTAIEWGVKEGPKAGPGSWGSIKDGLYHSVQDASRSNRPVLFPKQEAKMFWDRVGKGKAKL
ncbi:hypothetical protein P7C73_g1659, partial [Tremellales sp. Uapishka_1]